MYYFMAKIKKKDMACAFFFSSKSCTVNFCFYFLLFVRKLVYSNSGLCLISKEKCKYMLKFAYKYLQLQLLYSRTEDFHKNIRASVTVIYVDYPSNILIYQPRSYIFSSCTYVHQKPCAYLNFPVNNLIVDLLKYLHSQRKRKTYTIRLLTAL